MNMKAIAIFSFSIIGLLFLVILLSPKSKPKVNFQDTKPLSAPVISKNDPSIGPTDAPVTIVHYGYIGCEYCRKTQEDLVNITEIYPEEVRIVWKDFPNTSLSPHSYDAAIAGRCASNQKKFWDYQRFLFDYARELDEEIYFSIAESAEIRKGAFKRCLNKQATKDLVDANIEEAERLRITATPTIFINEKRITGQTTFWNIQEVVTEALREI